MLEMPTSVKSLEAAIGEIIILQKKPRTTLPYKYRLLRVFSIFRLTDSTMLMK